MAPFGVGPLRRLVEPLARVLPDGLQQPVAHLSPGRGRRHHQRLVDQRTEQRRHIAGVDAVARADLFRGGQIAATGEDGQPAQHGALGLIGQIPGPVDHRAQGLLPGQQGAAAAGQQPETVVEPVGQLPRGEHPQAGRGEFDGERQAVQPPADLGAGRRVVVDAETGAGGGPAVGEQAQCDRVGQWSDGPQHLARYGERLAARGQHRHSGAFGEQPLGEGRCGPDHMLAVVEHQQHPTACAVLGEPGERVQGGRVGGGPQALRGGAADDGLPGTECGEHRLRHGLRIVHRRELGEPDAVRPGVGGDGRGGFRALLRQPGLPRAAGTQQGHQPVCGEVGADRGEVRFAADEGGRPGPEVAGTEGGTGADGGSRAGCAVVGRVRACRVRDRVVGGGAVGGLVAAGPKAEGPYGDR